MKLVFRKAKVVTNAVGQKVQLARRTKYSFDPLRDGVTQSILSQWLTCREKARMSTVLGLSSSGASWPLVYGAIAHGCLEPYYGFLSTCKPVDFNYCCHFALNAFLGGGEATTLERRQMAEEAAAIMLVMLPHYHQKWIRHDEKVRWTVIEKKFRRLVREAKCVATGKIDGGYETLKAETHVPKGHWLFETKNKSSFNASYESWLGIDLQLGYYLLGYRELMGCTPIGAMYNVLRRPDRLKAKSVSFKDYLAKIDEDLKDRPDHYFMRYRVKFAQKEIADHESSIMRKLIEFRKWFDDNHDQRDLMYNPNACEQFGSTCPYLPSCSNGDRSDLTQRLIAHPELA